MKSGPLIGLKVVEFAGIGPGPFCGMFLSDLGADVLRINRKGATRLSGLSGTQYEFDARGRSAVALDLKSEAAIETCLELIEKADVLLEGYRPGVMERLGLGPEPALARNPRLVYGRMTGWGQTGPYAKVAGHDINYIAISGALHAMGTDDQPTPPLNLVGDYGGAVVHLVGLLAAVLHARQTGEGQVIDTAMSDVAAYLATLFYGLHGAGFWQGRRQANLLDGGAPFYGVFRCADDRWVSIGSIEPQFYALLLEKTGLKGKLGHEQMDRANWAAMRATFAEVFAQKTRQEWCDLMDGTDICFAPVLSFEEAPDHPHNRARETFVEVAGALQPAPVPRFSRTPGQIQCAPTKSEPSRTVLEHWGVTGASIHRLETDSPL